MLKIFSNIRIRSHYEVTGRIAIFLIFLSVHLSGQSSTIETLYSVGNSSNDAGYYNNATKNYSGSGGAGGFRITFASFKTSGSPDYKIKYRINSGVITNLVGATTISASMTVDILDSALPTISAGEKIIFFAVSDFGGVDATQTTCQADGNGYEAVTSSSGDADYFYYDIAKPTVTNVTSSTADATKKDGDAVSIQVTFSENVTVSGTPTLTLETGGTDAVVNYASTSNATLTFTYTVDSPHESADLDYKATTSLSAGTSIKDAAGNDATLTLPNPGASGSLGANKDLVIDGKSPSVTGVSCTSSAAKDRDGTSITDCSNGSYNDTHASAGGSNVFYIRVTFDEAVVVSGTPQLTLDFDNDVACNYNSGESTSTTLAFTYTVANGQTSDDLDYAATTSLSAGTSIKDAAGNDATRTLAQPGASGSLGANKALVIDTTHPTVHGTAGSKVYSGKAPGSYKVGEVIDIAVGFTETIYTSGTPTLTLNLEADKALDLHSGGGTGGSTALTFRYTVEAGQNSTDLDYTATNSLDDGTYVRDKAGNAATLTLPEPGASGSLGANEALVIDTTAPTLDGDKVDATTDDTYYIDDVVDIWVLFSEVVYVTGTPTLTLETGGHRCSS